jgi:hypothetical protein
VLRAEAMVSNSASNSDHRIPLNGCLSRQEVAHSSCVDRLTVMAELFEDLFSLFSGRRTNCSDDIAWVRMSKVLMSDDNPEEAKIIASTTNW